MKNMVYNIKKKWISFFDSTLFNNTGSGDDSGLKKNILLDKNKNTRELINKFINGMLYCVKAALIEGFITLEEIKLAVIAKDTCPDTLASQLFNKDD